MLKKMVGYNNRDMPKDLFIGVVIAAMSVPIAMGYAQIAGLPPVYGLYGSLIPILIFAFLSSSPQFVLGVDAAPCALVGGVILSMGIAPESSSAVEVVPMITLFVAGWLLFFFLVKAGRFVTYVSTPVMGGLITGICLTIILMQIPKLYGQGPGNGDLVELIQHIMATLGGFNLPSFLLGMTTLIILVIQMKLFPKIPGAVIMMAIGVLLTVFTNIEDLGVLLLPQVPAGLPQLYIPHLGVIGTLTGVIQSFAIAAVIMIETLLSEKNFALKNGYKINENRELLAFTVCNLSSVLIGCPPVSGSVSRTMMADKLGAKSQFVSISASLTMLLLLLFGVQFISYLPVPVLTAIVMAALISAMELHYMKRLVRASKADLRLFIFVMITVLLMGTLTGVILGFIVSFILVLKKTMHPSTDFLGVIPGKDAILSLTVNEKARPIKHTIIYKFNGHLFFGNIDEFQEKLEDKINVDTKVVIVEASGISEIDITAADRIEMIYKDLKKKNIRFYLTEHIAVINSHLREYGLEFLIKEGVIRKYLEYALEDAQIYPPYETEDDFERPASDSQNEWEEKLKQEHLWAYGKGKK